jgi:diacylglycerol kinase
MDFKRWEHRSAYKSSSFSFLGEGVCLQTERARQKSLFLIFHLFIFILLILPDVIRIVFISAGIEVH